MGRRGGKGGGKQPKRGIGLYGVSSISGCNNGGDTSSGNTTPQTTATMTATTDRTTTSSPNRKSTTISSAATSSSSSSYSSIILTPFLACCACTSSWLFSRLAWSSLLMYHKVARHAALLSCWRPAAVSPTTSAALGILSLLTIISFLFVFSLFLRIVPITITVLSVHACGLLLSAGTDRYLGMTGGISYLAALAVADLSRRWNQGLQQGELLEDEGGPIAVFGCFYLRSICAGMVCLWSFRLVGFLVIQQILKYRQLEKQRPAQHLQHHHNKQQQNDKNNNTSNVDQKQQDRNCKMKRNAIIEATTNLIENKSNNQTHHTTASSLASSVGINNSRLYTIRNRRLQFAWAMSALSVVAAGIPVWLVYVSSTYDRIEEKSTPAGGGVPDVKVVGGGGRMLLHRVLFGLVTYIVGLFIESVAEFQKLRFAVGNGKWAGGRTETREGGDGGRERRGGGEEVAAERGGNGFEGLVVVQRSENKLTNGVGSKGLKDDAEEYVGGGEVETSASSSSLSSSSSSCSSLSSSSSCSSSSTSSTSCCSSSTSCSTSCSASSTTTSCSTSCSTSTSTSCATSTSCSSTSCSSTSTSSALSSRPSSLFLSTGLWRYSRHPNYFGEILIWFGIYVVCSSCLPPQLSTLSILSPFWVIISICFVSGIPLVEAQADKEFICMRAYRTYKERTSMLLLLPPRVGGWSLISLLRRKNTTLCSGGEECEGGVRTKRSVQTKVGNKGGKEVEMTQTTARNVGLLMDRSGLLGGQTVI
eukprot:GHVS01026440.1.p1 GENE.GHVS01026440.1~~GHVS01026440.1.p1  ORF type:complete len:759 (+),score=210.58 GHVS01026440.1:461-2737(+)